MTGREPFGHVLGTAATPLLLGSHPGLTGETDPSRPPIGQVWDLRRRGIRAVMSTVTEAVDVRVPLRVAYDLWTRFESFPRFMVGVKEVRRIDPAHTHWVLDIAGRRHEFDATITEQHPDKRVAWHSDAEPTHSGVITFHRLDDTHTRVIAQMDIDPDGFVENVADKLGVLTHRIRSDLKKFKECVEAGGTEPGTYPL